MQRTISCTSSEAEKIVLCGQHLLRQSRRHLVLIEAVASGEHLGRTFHGGQEVNYVQESTDSVLGVVPNRDKSDRNT